MKKMLVFMIICVPLYAWGDNAVFNPGFDISPWDTGWTKDTLTKVDFWGDDTAWANVIINQDTGRSLPNCCWLEAYASANTGTWGGHATGEGIAMISQSFNEITNCIIKVWIKYRIEVTGNFQQGLGKSECSMQFLVNRGWKPFWSIDYSTSHNFYVEEDNIWAKVCTTIVNDTISGIRFQASSYAYAKSGSAHGGGYSKADLWIDDISVGEIGIEENGESQVTSCKLQVYPNPFIKFAEVRSEK